VRELEGVEFEWDDSAAPTPDDDDRHVGFLAQDVAEVLPEAVAEHASGYEGTADAAFTPVLVEAVTELAETVEDQRETIDEQRAELDAREARLADQRDRVDRLESRLADLEAEVRADGDGEVEGN
jgi:ubiquinone biosynthesis protein UbiJ